MPRDIFTMPLTPEVLYQRVQERARQKTLKHGETLHERALYTAQLSPEWRTQLLDKAQQVLKGCLILPGTEGKPFFVGNPPNWYANPVNDTQYICSLNRMGHWTTLLTAYSLTQEPVYAQKVIQELDNWLKVCPRPSIERSIQAIDREFDATVPLLIPRADQEFTPWLLLDAGIRMFSNWPHIIGHLIETELLTPDLLYAYAVSLYEHGELLAEIAPRVFIKADNNQYLMESLGLLALSCQFPEFRTAEQWRNQAIQQLEDCAQAQLTRDGGHIEGCPHYHNHCMYFFCKALIIAKENGITFSTDYIERVQKGFAYSIYSFRPSGTGVPWGDSDADQLAIQSAFYSHASFGTWDWLDILSHILDIETIKEACSRYILNLPEVTEVYHQIEVRDVVDTLATLPTVSWQHELKQVALRTNWSREALSVFFACRTPVHNAHAHIDPMSFDFTALGKPLVVDPGRYTYREDDDRKNFKSAKWHNSLTINHQEPFEYISSWAFGPSKPGEIITVQDTPDLLVVEAEHYNYAPAVHRRLLAIVNATYVLVLDQIVELDPQASVQLYYHLDAERVTWDADLQCAYTRNDDVNVALYTTRNVYGELLEGKVSDKIDHARPSSRLLLQDATTGTSERYYATVIVPYRSDVSRPEFDIEMLETSPEKITCSCRVQNTTTIFTWQLGYGLQQSEG